MVGTPEYLAPETVKGVGHGIPVDYWALGCIVYEMLAGYSPFAGDNVEDTVQVCSNVVEGEVEFNREENNFEKLSEDFVRRLLNRDPLRRLGRGHGGAGEAFSHPWLEGYNTHLVQRKILRPPWVPKIEDETGTAARLRFVSCSRRVGASASRVFPRDSADASCFEDYGDEDMDPSMLVYDGPDGEPTPCQMGDLGVEGGSTRSNRDCPLPSGPELGWSDF
eukprot:scaffold1060_cov246-Pinguiococcus_pyrenoidosus.AAC.14